MPREGSRGVLGFPNNQLVDSLDEVAKGLAEGTISRGRAIKFLGASLLVPVLIPFSAAPAQAADLCMGKARFNNRTCPSFSDTVCKETANQICSCIETVSGATRCIDVTHGLLCPKKDECDRNRDCASGKICVKIGGCCGGRRRNKCAPKCS